MRNFFLFLPFSVYSSFSFSAYNADLDTLLDMSLEELTNIKVVTVSKREESINDAPGVVSVYTAKDINSFGARNLKDVLLRIPNFYMFDSSTFTATGSTMRAGATQHLNNHVLYLVNGRPLRESQNGGRHTDINLLFPISAIERIEVIRGPGSVLYGSNAFNGTINIITKKAKKGFNTDANVAVGSYGHQTLELSSYAGNGDDAGIEANIKLTEEDGSEISAYDSLGIAGSSQLYREGYLARLDGHYKGFSAEGIISEITLPNISGTYKWSGLGEWQHKREYINLAYQHTFNENWSSTFNYSKNNLQMDIEVPTQSQFSSDGYMYELTVNGKVSDEVDILLGAVKNHVSGDLGLRGGRYNNLRRSAYGQVDYRFIESTKVTVGFQVNKPDEQDAKVSPRLALVHQFNERWAGKVLYAEAFRSPFGSEINFDSAFLKGDENLEPETIKTAELQLIYSGENKSITSTLYQSKTNNLIGRGRIDNTTYFVNTAQEISYQGIEVEGKWILSSNLSLQGNVSYQENEDDNGIEDYMVSSNVMAKLGLSYQTSFGLMASIWNNYLGEVSKVEDLPGSIALVVNPEAEAVNLLSLNLVASLGDMFNKENWREAKLSLFANNLLDEAVWYPEMGYKTVNTYPQSHARGVYLNFSMNF